MQNQQILLEPRTEEDKHYTRSLIRKYLSHKSLYIVTSLLVLATAMLYLWMATPLYRIQSSLIIKDDEAGKNVSFDVSQLDLFTNAQSIDNEIQIIRSNNVINNAVSKLNLNIGNYEKEVDGMFYTPLFTDLPFYFELIKISEELVNNPLKFIELSNSSFQLLNNKKSYLFDEIISYKGGLFKIKKTNFTSSAKKNL